MNTGLQDAINLAWKLALVCHGNATELLDSYEPERRPVAETSLRWIRSLPCGGRVGMVELAGCQRS
jgi:2-polyprenyl-6-methoxyphenol hydroxylase-like FAD-dependent oxidoreductase